MGISEWLMSERCPLRTTDQTQEVSEYFYFTNLYFSVFIFLPSLLLSFLSLFTSCSSLHPCYTCFLHFFLSFFLKSFWPILLLYFLHSYFLFPLWFFFCFSLPSHFLSCVLITFVSLPSLVRASLFEFDFFFLPCVLHLLSQSFRLKVWSVRLILWRHLHFTEVWLWQPYLSFTHLSNQEAGSRYWTSFPLEWP